MVKYTEKMGIKQKNGLDFFLTLVGSMQLLNTPQNNCTLNLLNHINIALICGDIVYELRDLTAF